MFCSIKFIGSKSRAYPLRNHLINRPHPRASDKEREADADHQEMILVTFTQLLARPVHEKSVLEMRGDDGAEHNHHEAHRREACQQSGDQPQTAEELSNDHQQRDDPRQMHGLREESHGPGEPESAIPPQQLLGTMWEHHQPESETKNEPCPAIICLKELPHRASPLVVSSQSTWPMNLSWAVTLVIIVLVRTKSTGKMPCLVLS